ncbi:hypothetical protein L4D20_21210 [Vibrio kyushuensis]|uniref:hypothetical protein n=1 Tax=Vibrio kyushuensis TaxID=2910249 RepID=UPI003D1230C6
MKKRLVSRGTYSKQRGVTALLVTALLLMGTLAFALGSYRGVFYQIKVANNQIDDRKAHWRSEGGLECGFSSMVFNNDSSIPTNLNSICSDMDLNSLQASVSDPERLVARYNNKKVSKSITFSSGTGAGAVKSTSDLLIRGSTLISPPDPGYRNSEGDYECVAVVVSNYILATYGMVNDGVGEAITKPSADFDNSSDCAAGYKTDIEDVNVGIWRDSSNNHVSFHAENDLQHDETLNPFKELFEKERGEWEQVRDNPENEFLTYTMLGSDINCVDKFKNDLILGKPNKVWIDGSCQLDSSEVHTIQSSNPGTYLFLIVHNGVLSISGAATIEGVLFHFNESYAAHPDNWQGFTNIADLNFTFDAPISMLYGESTLLTPKHATFFQSGSMQFTGGMIFDTRGQMALFNNSMRLQFNSDITSSFEFSAKPKWKKGSWSDH